jgi:hypothetical protein
VVVVAGVAFRRSDWQQGRPPPITVLSVGLRYFLDSRKIAPSAKMLGPHMLVCIGRVR